MIRIGLLSFSDGRERVHRSLAPAIEQAARKVKTALEADGTIEVVPGTEIIWKHSQARSQARFLRSQQVDGTIFNVPVFAFPNLARIASHFAPAPFLAFSPRFGGLPGLGGMLGAANALEQTGVPCERVYGSIEDGDVLGKLAGFCRAAHAASGLRGRVLGLVGGRSIGMVTGEASPDLYDSVFGVDIDHIDQLEIVRRAPGVPEARVEQAFSWLETHVKRIDYDGKKLTPESLKEQIRHYYATKEIIQERELDFVAVKCHYEMSEYFSTQCLSAAFLNDPYDWEGPKEPCVFSCEADADGAVTMQILKLVSGKPVIFTDLRHHDQADDVLVLCNCGAMSTWYAGRSEDPEVNLKEVSLVPVIPKYGGSGCHVRYIAGEGKMTFSRLYRREAQYRMTIFTAEIEAFPEKKLEETCPAWPHLFARSSFPAQELIPRQGSNHVHGVSGDYVEELARFCEWKDIVAEIY